MIRVLIVDDSAIVRKILTEELSKYDDLEIVGSAVDPYVARDKIVQLSPDVITLDLEMPRMDGLSFLARLMKYHPMPVVVLSSLTPKNSETAFRALELGAVEVLAKPGSAYSTQDVSRHVARAIRGAASARIERGRAVEPAVQTVSRGREFLLKTTNKVLAIGASTGGTKAIETVLRGLPSNCPGTVIVQHMPEHFTSTFAQRLDEVSGMEVREAVDNDHVVNGVALVAPGNRHMVLVRSGGVYLVKIKTGPRVHYQRPSVDVLFQSVARHAGPNAVGVLLTGMGADGAKGLAAMRERGAHTVVQNEETCVVFGMPKEAIKCGAAAEIRPLQAIPNAVVEAFRNDRGVHC
jgi:two-component system, chemotaxis family, protein-glutamate methylesterase/glutaminase